MEDVIAKPVALMNVDELREYALAIRSKSVVELKQVRKLLAHSFAEALGLEAKQFYPVTDSFKQWIRKAYSKQVTEAYLNKIDTDVYYEGAYDTVLFHVRVEGIREDMLFSEGSIADVFVVKQGVIDGAT